MPEVERRRIEGRLRIINWNIGGAKYLELKSRASDKFVDPPDPKCKDLGWGCPDQMRKDCKNKCREGFRIDVNEGLRYLMAQKPDVITLQEVVRYRPHADLRHSEDVIDRPDDYGYHYIPMWLIDTVRHGARGKWDKVKENGDWSGDPFFAQGNAFLLRDTISVSDGVAYFPVYAIPKPYRNRDDFRAIPIHANQRWDDPPGRGCMECVQLEPGMYFGDRDTEPRAALVAHMVLSGPSDGGGGGMRDHLDSPLDVFVVNVHLTTLMGEREGIPGIDEQASQTRLRQLDIVLNKLVSKYNQWRRDGYRIREKPYDVRAEYDTTKRHQPIWVITGDFNFTPESVEYQTMLRRGFIDLMPKRFAHQSVSHRPTKAKGAGNDPTITLDYVFAGPRLAALDPHHVEDGIQDNKVETEQVKASDHYPLIVDLPISVEEPL